MKRRQTVCMKRFAFVKFAGTESRGNSKASVRSKPQFLKLHT